MMKKQLGKKVKGHINLPFIKDKEDDDEESDDEEDDSWLDYGDMSPGSGQTKRKKPKISRVNIVDNDGKHHSCSGRFPLTQPYWTVTAHIHNHYLRSPPAYTIYPDTRKTVKKDSDVMLLLDDCLQLLKDIKPNTASATKVCFDIFCKQRENAEPVSLSNLETVLKTYAEQEAKQCQFIRYPHKNVFKWTSEDHGLHVYAALHSDLGKTVRLAISHAELVQTVSRLLPFVFLSFFHNLNLELVGSAAQMAHDSPWEFGFRQIIYKKLKLKGAEASYESFDKGEFFPSMPQLYHDALFIYEVLKVDARRDGHMYIPYCKLTRYYLFEKMKYKINSAQRWEEALRYLKAKEVIVIERFQGDDNVFLKNNWQAEMDITNGVERVLKEYCSHCHNFDFDFSSAEFDQIRTDPDQVKALYSTACFPITVLSGSGGCGKTTVVTTLLKHLCRRKERRLEQEHAEVHAEKHDSEEESKRNEKREIRQQTDKQALSALPDAMDRANISNTTSEDIPDHTHLSNSDDEQREKTDQSALRSSHGESGNAESTVAVEGNEEANLEGARVSDLIKILKSNRVKDSSQMQVFKEKFLLTAPTGKAARLLGCKASLTSATIHSVIVSWSRHTEGEWKYANVEVLVVDECSLVSVGLFARVLNILTQKAKLTKIILLGDTKQLPSIDPGDFLRDIFRSLSQPGFSIQLSRNHRSESSLIVENAKKISRRQMPTFDPSKRFHFIEIPEDGGDCERDEAIRQLLNTNEDLQSHIQSQFVAFRNKYCQAINELCCKHYNGHSTMKRKSDTSMKEVQDFKPGDKICLGKNSLVHNSFELLMEDIADCEEYKSLAGLSRKKGGRLKNRGMEEEALGEDLNAGRNVLTAAEATSLFEGEEDALDQTVANMKEQDDARERERRERIKRAAEKSRAWKLKRLGNGKDKPTDDGEKESTKEGTPDPLAGLFKSEEKLCNGEVFFIMDEKLKEDGKEQFHKYFVLSDRDPHQPNVVCVSERDLRRSCKMKHSWARTIHTYQGSESDTVIYVVGEAVPQNWQHVYTGVTRGKKAVYVVSKQSQLQIAINRRDQPRNSRLYDRLREMLLDSASETFNFNNKNLLENPSQTSTRGCELKKNCNPPNKGMEDDCFLSNSELDSTLNFCPEGEDPAQNDPAEFEIKKEIPGSTGLNTMPGMTGNPLPAHTYPTVIGVKKEIPDNSKMDIATDMTENIPAQNFTTEFEIGQEIPGSSGVNTMLGMMGNPPPAQKYPTVLEIQKEVPDNSNRDPTTGVMGNPLRAQNYPTVLEVKKGIPDNSIMDNATGVMGNRLSAQLNPTEFEIKKEIPGSSGIINATPGLMGNPSPAQNYSPGFKIQRGIPNSNNSNVDSTAGMVWYPSPPTTPPRNNTILTKHDIPVPNVPYHAQNETPPKLRRLEGNRLVVDTPFRESFSQTLSLDGEQDSDNEEEDPFPSRKTARRKL